MTGTRLLHALRLLTRLRAVVWLVLLAVCLSSPALTAQQPPPPSAQGNSNTIRVNARIIVLDVVVTDKKGKLTRAPLTRDDFTILEDAQPQQIRSFEAPTEHAMPAGPGGAPMVNSAADLGKIGDAPVTIMVLDELNGRFEDMAYARQMMVKYLQAQPAVLTQPTLLLVATNTKFVQVHDYTQNRDELLEIIRKHMPEVPWRLMNGGRSGAGAVERMAQVLAALQQISQASSGTPGRKNIIWVGNGFPSADLVGLDTHQGDLIQAAIRRVTAQLLAARVTMYTINPTEASIASVDVESPDDLATSADENGGDPFGTGKVAFTNLAPATGGLAFTGRNDLNNLIAEGIADGQQYYTLSYSPSDKTNDPAKFRKIKIVMKDPNLRATTRDGYYQETGADLNPVAVDKETSAKQVARNLTLDLSQALTSAMSYNGLEVTAEKGSAAGSWTLRVKGSGIGWSDPDASGAQHEEATIGAAWYDAKGTILGHVFHEETAPRPADPNAPDAFALQLALPPGVKRIRFVVRDALNGHMGTADVTKF